MAKGDDSSWMSTSMLRSAAAEDSIEQDNPVVPSRPREIPTAFPPPPSTAPIETDLSEEEIQSLINSIRSATLTPQETHTCLQSLSNLMTSSVEEDAAPFKEVITKLDGSELQRMASLLTSSSDYFLEIARNKNGSKRLQMLLGKSDDADTFFFDSILGRYFDVMTDKHAFNVVIQGMRVFSQQKKMLMCGLILYHAIRLACDRYGCVALNEIITHVEDSCCRRHLRDIVVSNARVLSYDAYGNFVVQNVLGQSDLRRTHYIALNLRGHCLELSFMKNGSFIMQKLLETKEARVVVVGELLECVAHKLMRLASSDCGSFVVEKALRLTLADGFWGLVDKLMPFRDILRTSRRKAVSDILESVC